MPEPGVRLNKRHWYEVAGLAHRILGVEVQWHTGLTRERYGPMTTYWEALCGKTWLRECWHDAGLKPDTNLTPLCPGCLERLRDEAQAAGRKTQC